MSRVVRTLSWALSLVNQVLRQVMGAGLVTGPQPVYLIFIYSIEARTCWNTTVTVLQPQTKGGVEYIVIA